MAAQTLAWGLNLRSEWIHLAWSADFNVPPIYVSNLGRSELWGTLRLHLSECPVAQLSGMPGNRHGCPENHRPTQKRSMKRWNEKLWSEIGYHIFIKPQS